MSTQDSKEELIITKGEDAQFSIYLVNTQGRPVDLTSFTEFKFCVDGTVNPITLTQVVNVNGSLIEKVAPDVLGQLQVTMKREDTALLREGFAQDIDIEWGDGTDRKRKRISKVLNVQGSICED